MKSSAVAVWLRRRPQTFLALALGLALLASYISSYLYLSRRGMREAKTSGMTGTFLYIPLDEALRTEDLSRHYALAILYAPANAADQALTGADAPVRCMIFRLSR